MTRSCKFGDGTFGLELTQEELDVLVTVCSSIGGDQDTLKNYVRKKSEFTDGRFEKV